jgi:hypothetical protein
MQYDKFKMRPPVNPTKTFLGMNVDQRTKKRFARGDGVGG